MDYDRLLHDIRLIVRQEIAGARNQGIKKQFLTIQEAVSLTKFSTREIRNLVKQRSIPFVTVRGKLRFKSKELMRWLESGPVIPKPKNWDGKGSITFTVGRNTVTIG